MRPTRFHPEPLKRLLLRKHIATMPELKQALGTSSDATVFRKLEGLFYASSYSHRGSYYTLREIAEFDEYGLWSHRGAHFSEYGTLVSTAEHFVEQSEAGWQARELEAILQVSVKQSLLSLQGRRGRSGSPRRSRAQACGKKTPEVLAAIEALMEHDTAGDPQGAMKWMRRTMDRVADELRALRLNVGPTTVARAGAAALARSRPRPYPAAQPPGGRPRDRT